MVIVTITSQLHFLVLFYFIKEIHENTQVNLGELECTIAYGYSYDVSFILLLQLYL